MTTQNEYEALVRAEVEALEDAWEKLWGRPDQEESSAQQHDMFHPPPGLGHFISNWFTSGVGAINKAIEAKLNEGSIAADGSETADYALQRTYELAMFIAVRMFRLGQIMHESLPYDGLQICPCATVFEEDLETLDEDALNTFLKMAAELSQRGGETNETLPVPEGDGGSVRDDHQHPLWRRDGYWQNSGGPSTRPEAEDDSA